MRTGGAAPSACPRRLSWGADAHGVPAWARPDGPAFLYRPPGSREKLQPTAELQKARQRIAQAKVRSRLAAHHWLSPTAVLEANREDWTDTTQRDVWLAPVPLRPGRQLAIRDCLRLLDEAGGDVAIDAALFDADGEVEERHVRLAQSAVSCGTLRGMDAWQQAVLPHLMQPQHAF